MAQSSAPGGAASHTVELTVDELIVLDHWLHALDARADFEELAPTRAERTVLWSLLAQTERQNPAVFAADYDRAVAAARARLDPGAV
ncbi:hypothetical protein CLV63_13428 [Murinocardiopsis flavida]|uniref:Uncharacterized protein n=1 Tax=Murinocardiopsis flavida TaxID=645275 RepID=A0A2P8CNL3_9ACTN|nr:hypothetical protein [Murinocardiopsis flavida]PSK86541.1 hypothetical protein CLV63_13428 [Murinocardiopsis flavida]